MWIFFYEKPIQILLKPVLTKPAHKTLFLRQTHRFFLSATAPLIKHKQHLNKTKEKCTHLLPWRRCRIGLIQLFTSLAILRKLSRTSGNIWNVGRNTSFAVTSLAIVNVLYGETCFVKFSKICFASKSGGNSKSGGFSKFSVDLCSKSKALSSSLSNIRFLGVVVVFSSKHLRSCTHWITGAIFIWFAADARLRLSKNLMALSTFLVSIS